MISRIPALAAVMALAATACGAGAAPVSTDTALSTAPLESSTTTTAPIPATTTPTTTATSTSSSTSSSTSTSTSTTTAPSTTTDTSALPGEPFDLGWPAAGDTLAVAGVSYDDQLNVRAGPGTDQRVLAALAPTATDAVATGRTRALDASIWHEVRVGGVTGWVSAAYVAYIGATDDATAAIVEQIGRPTTADMESMATLVADHLTESDDLARSVVSQAPGQGDLAEVTVDVVGFGDDSVLGVRLRIFAESGSDGYTLRTVEETVLCRRGVSGDGVCI